MIKTNKMSKVYGCVLAINEGSLELDKGVIYGFIGPNGGGKTSTIKELFDSIFLDSARGKIIQVASIDDRLKDRKVCTCMR